MGLPTTARGESSPGSEPQGNLICPVCTRAFIFRPSPQNVISELTLINDQKGWLVKCPGRGEILFVVSRSVIEQHESLRCECYPSAGGKPEGQLPPNKLRGILGKVLTRQAAGHSSLRQSTSAIQPSSQSPYVTHFFRYTFAETDAPKKWNKLEVKCPTLKHVLEILVKPDE